MRTANSTVSPMPADQPDLSRQARRIDGGEQQKAQHDGDAGIEEAGGHQIERECHVQDRKHRDGHDGARRKHEPAGRDAQQPQRR